MVHSKHSYSSFRPQECAKSDEERVDYWSNQNSAMADYLLNQGRHCPEPLQEAQKNH